MNERIKELLEQSGLQPYYDSQQGHIEKFAELIVKECIQIVHQKTDDSVKVAFAIEQHFGG